MLFSEALRREAPRISYDSKELITHIEALDVTITKILPPFSRPRLIYSTPRSIARFDQQNGD
jgi:hypothetical protein